MTIQIRAGTGWEAKPLGLVKAWPGSVIMGGGMRTRRRQLKLGPRARVRGLGRDGRLWTRVRGRSMDPRHRRRRAGAGLVALAALVLAGAGGVLTAPGSHSARPPRRPPTGPPRVPVVARRAVLSP